MPDALPQAPIAPIVRNAMRKPRDLPLDPGEFGLEIGSRALSVPNVAPRTHRPGRELVQLDGSFHPWFEERGPHSCLLTLVDDAIGRASGGSGRGRRFGPRSRSCARGLSASGFRGRSAQIGRMSMCDAGIRRIAIQGPNR